MIPTSDTQTRLCSISTPSSSSSEFLLSLPINFLHSPPTRNDPTPSRSAQLPRAASLIISSLGFIHDLRTGILDPDTVRGTPLDMDQYKQLFGTARIPTDQGCKMETASDSTHIIVLRRGQFCMCLSVLLHSSSLLTNAPRSGQHQTGLTFLMTRIACSCQSARSCVTCRR